MDETDYRDKKFSLADGLTRRQAEKHLRMNLKNVQVMKNRLKVLTSQAEYNQYRQKFQSSKIDYHFQIHEELAKEKEQIKAVQRQKDDSLIKKQANDRMAKQLRYRLNEVFERLKNEKTEQSKEIKQRSLKNVQFLTKRKAKDLQNKKMMKNEIVKMEGSIKQKITRYSLDKKEDLKTIKKMQKKSMCDLAEHVAKQLQELNKREKQLINIGCESFKSSRVLDQQYKELYGRKNFGRSIHLPGIKKSIDHSDTANTQ